ncbi:MAG: flagellar basal body-associated FliL family protein [Succinivibrionaceae bacterium]|nr:flagellar basal body-associated FliL family protein [Succinivibrionaceae bacterium]
MAGEGELKLNEQGGGGKSKKLVLIIVLLVLIGGGAGAFFMLKGGSEPAENQEEVVVKDVYHYVPVNEPFLFTARAKPKGHLVQVKLVLEVKGDNNKSLAVHHMPAIKDAVSKFLSDVQYADIIDAKGKDRLKAGIQKSVQGCMNRLEREPIIETVLYDGFVIQ